jgi:sortase A
MSCFGAACASQAERTPEVGVGLGLRLPTTTTVPGPEPVAERRVVRPSLRLAASSSARSRARPAEIGRIVIPKLGLDLETYEGVDAWTLRFGPGHWEVTARPGQVGNATFAGHRTTFTHPFDEIDRLQVGDEVTFVTADGSFTYATTEFFVVGQTDVWIAEPTPTPTFTLFACHPRGSERQRYVVKGELVRAENASAPPPEPAPSPPRSPRTCLLCRS